MTSEVVSAGLHGMYRDVLRDRSGRILWDRGWRKNAIVTALFGSIVTQPVPRSNCASTAMPTLPTCLPPDISNGRTWRPVVPSVIWRSANVSVTLKMRLITAVGKAADVFNAADCVVPC